MFGILWFLRSACFYRKGRSLNILKKGLSSHSHWSVLTFRPIAVKSIQSYAVGAELQTEPIRSHVDPEPLKCVRRRVRDRGLSRACAPSLLFCYFLCSCFIMEMKKRISLELRNRSPTEVRENPAAAPVFCVSGKDARACSVVLARATPARL